ncbi:MAG TPA: FAD-binding protein [Chitinivibrionales bacterium]|nr:FAD-binding protein [Chitinivibrionales bacterium]
MSTKKILITHNGKKISIPCHRIHTLVIGSGAAGLNAAVQLHANGITDLCIVTEGLSMGTSINTGSDKQTYYKLGMYGGQDDSPMALAESFFGSGGMHGDLALVEAALSARAFLNLVNLGVKFPSDKYGQVVGYKTDHDPRQRATSVGPYTSREMCRALIREAKRRGIDTREKRVAVSLLTVGEGASRRAAGAVVMNLCAKTAQSAFEMYLADNVVFAAGGPGGLYKTSVYPTVHTGGIGLALLADAKAQGLPESQYGMASIKFRWNVSGTYMQVIPRFISTAADGASDEREFMRPFFANAGEMSSMVFLKGYQWPFDPRKVAGGSSIVDILVYIETVIKGRRVFLDYRRNPDEFDFNALSKETHDYLEKSGALLGTPVERLKKMNQPAIDLYKDHGIDITKEPLEIAVCSQHNNGGLAGNLWWESLNVKHLFPVGEVNGSHGIYRPGGSALNSGQVAGFRAAEYISHRYDKKELSESAAAAEAKKVIARLLDWIEKGKTSKIKWQESRAEFQARMTKAGAHIRSAGGLAKALPEARRQFQELSKKGSSCRTLKDAVESLRNLQLCFAHVAYLDAVKFAVDGGVGSRGSAIVLDKNGIPAHKDLGPEWNFARQDETFQDKVMETDVVSVDDATFSHRWVPRRPLPQADAWFETAWQAYRNGDIYK